MGSQSRPPAPPVGLILGELPLLAATNGDTRIMPTKARQSAQARKDEALTSADRHDSAYDVDREDVHPDDDFRFDPEMMRELAAGETWQDVVNADKDRFHYVYALTNRKGQFGIDYYRSLGYKIVHYRENGERPRVTSPETVKASLGQPIRMGSHTLMKTSLEIHKFLVEQGGPNGDGLGAAREKARRRLSGPQHQKTGEVPNKLLGFTIAET